MLIEYANMLLQIAVLKTKKKEPAFLYFEKAAQKHTLARDLPGPLFSPPHQSGWAPSNSISFHSFQTDRVF